jgi:hypothetical protein
MEQENPRAYNMLGNLYRNGFPVAQDDIEAAWWFRKAAELGDFYGQYALGSLYYQGESTSPNHLKAKYYLEKAINNPQADTWIKESATRLLNGIKEYEQKDILHLGAVHPVIADEMLRERKNEIMVKRGQYFTGSQKAIPGEKDTIHLEACGRAYKKEELGLLLAELKKEALMKFIPPITK